MRGHVYVFFSHVCVCMCAGDVQSMQLTLDGEPAVTEVSQVAVERKEGRYDVTCAASGFSPGATVALYIGQERLETSDPRLTPDLPTSRRRLARRYTASVTADKVGSSVVWWVGGLV